ncbi:unnamed protein product [Aphanomyces euteiches]
MQLYHTYGRGHQVRAKAIHLSTHYDVLLSKHARYYLEHASQQQPLTNLSFLNLQTTQHTNHGDRQDLLLSLGCQAVRVDPNKRQGVHHVVFPFHAMDESLPVQVPSRNEFGDASHATLLHEAPGDDGKR